uniref:Secreted protein n=1 Tax=Syphacia muris TaxID=451379 RepID=A0A0N5AWH5_9BILA
MLVQCGFALLLLLHLTAAHMMPVHLNLPLTDGNGPLIDLSETVDTDYSDDVSKYRRARRSRGNSDDSGNESN